MLQKAKTQPATFFGASNECAIYLLRSFTANFMLG